MATVIVSVNRYFPETQKVSKNGKPQRIVIDVRKMEIFDGLSIDSGRFTATVVKRGGERYVSVKERKTTKRSWWDKQPVETADVGQYLKIQALREKKKEEALNKWEEEALKNDERKWKKEGNYSLEKFERWLALTIKDDSRAKALVSELLTAPPENAAA